ncbi:MAG: TorF family putative porin [Cytophagales bacterium]|nr:TorF family putative porin [Cytophagales bacterium]
MSFKLTVIAIAALVTVNWVSAQTTAPAAPQAAEPDYTISYNVGAVTDYRFRGISQTSNGPAIQGGIDFAHKSGVYLGAWVSNVVWVRAFNGASQSNMELDWYGGYKTEVAKDTTLDVGAIHYGYPGNNSGAAGTVGAGAWSNANTNEFYGALTYRIYTAKYSRSTGDFLGNINSKGSTYIDLSAAVDLGNGMTLTPHIGHQKVENTAAANYTDYALTLAKDMGRGLSLTGAVMGTSSGKNKGAGFYNNYAQFDGKYVAGSTLVLGAKYTF